MSVQSPHHQAAGSSAGHPPITASHFFLSLPVSSFAMVMGLSGLSLVWARTASLGWLPGWAPLISGLTGLLAFAVFVVLAVLYAGKWSRNPKAVQEEWQHPVKSSFFAAVSVSFALLATVSFHLFSPLALPLWVVGSVLQVLAMIMVLNAWVHRETLAPVHASPVWFIPAVANVVIPLAGVRLGFVELSWWFFAVGILFWGLLLTLVMARLLFVQPPLPERLIPTLCIFLAPPAVGFLSWVLLSGQYADGRSLDVVGHLLYGSAIFFALFLLSQLRRFVRLPFYLSWWAFSFPVAAFTTATLVYQSFVPTIWMQTLAVGLVAFSTVLITWLLVRTVVAIVRAEPQLID
jgi:tellurite resistance protein